MRLLHRVAPRVRRRFRSRSASGGMPGARGGFDGDIGRRSRIRPPAAGTCRS